MRIVIIGGFLGSGKTTTLKNLLLQLSEEERRKIVLVINDFGEVGIDASVTRMDGVNPVELVSGCVCCQMSGDLLSRVKEIYHKLAPEIIILEPSGVADSGSLRALLSGRVIGMEDVPITEVCNLVLVDPVRFNDLFDRVGLIRSGIRAADLVVITKTDLVDEVTLDEVRAQVDLLNGRVRVMEVSNLHPDSLYPLMEVVKSGLN